WSPFAPSKERSTTLFLAGTNNLTDRDRSLPATQLMN
ncbi:MAG: hypothetical protein ACI814_000198, partial [Mariniblastus sp.]